MTFLCNHCMAGWPCQHLQRVCEFFSEGGGLQVGVYLSKELMSIAGRSLKANITTLGPLVLPWSEQARFLANFFARKVSSWQSSCQMPIHDSAGGAR